MLMIVQMAAALFLLVGSGLIFYALLRLERQDRVPVPAARRRPPTRHAPVDDLPRAA